MKTGNVILAIFLWLCIPSSFFIGGFFGLFGGGIGGGVICAVVSPLVLFILGLVALITGMEGKPQSVKQESTIRNVESKFKESNRKTSLAECELCGKLKDTRDLRVYEVDGKELFLCEKCGNRITSKLKETVETDIEAFKVLNLRYAKGEITKEEYEEIKKELKS